MEIQESHVFVTSTKKHKLGPKSDSEIMYGINEQIQTHFSKSPLLNQIFKQTKNYIGLRFGPEINKAPQPISKNKK
jgi:hypothetical protein